MFPSKILPLFLSPIVIVLGLILAGAIFRRRWPVFLGALILLIGSLPAVADRLLDLSQGHVVRRDPASLPRAEAVVVLAGALNVVPGARGPEPEWNEAVDRVIGGAQLMLAGRAEALVLSGTRFPGEASVVSEAEYARRLVVALGVAPEVIRLPPPAFNTAEEAANIRPLFQSASPKIILVTSAWHMSRAMQIFTEAGFQVEPFPVDFSLRVERRFDEVWLPRANALLKTDTVVREYLGRGFYRLKHALGD